MCSIAGIINPAEPESARSTVIAMNCAQQHRGPDSSGIFFDGTVALGHRRLSIIALDSGAQPMDNEDHSLHLVFNGEIYNFSRLREELMQKGHVFRTDSDTEVILHLYEEYGEKLAEKLEGMFAFALWDVPRRKVLLGRDRLGQKPLLYFRRGRKLVFASEMAALRCDPDFPSELDPAAISDFLSLQYVPSPRSAYRQVEKLPPAHTLWFDVDSGKVKQRRFWDPDYLDKNDLRFDAAAAWTRELVSRAVQKRLMADVPSGVFLSGGLDSAVVAMLAAKLRLPDPTCGFTIGFADPAYDERSGARLMAAQISRLTGGAFEHFEKEVDAGDFGLLRKLAGHFGEPYADASMLPTYLLAQFAREKATMVLSGDGADEVFGGYERYIAMRLAAQFDHVPLAMRQGLLRRIARALPDAGERTRSGRMRRFLLLAAEPVENRYAELLNRCPAELKRKLAGDALRPGLHDYRFPVYASCDPVERWLETDLHTYLPGDILPKVDIASMAVSLEVRSPFFDHELIEFAAGLPLDYKLRGMNRKRLLKAAFADCIPPEIRQGRKRGFGIPLAAWLRGRWAEPARDALFGGILIRDGWMNLAALEEIWNQHQSGERDFSYLLFNGIMLSLFLETSRN